MDELVFYVVPRNYDSIKSDNSFNKFKTVKIEITPVDEVAENYISKLEIGPKGKAMDILSLGIVQEESQKSRKIF